jgi:hypothetical protein
VYYWNTGRRSGLGIKVVGGWPLSFPTGGLAYASPAPSRIATPLHARNASIRITVIAIARLDLGKRQQAIWQTLALFQIEYSHSLISGDGFGGNFHA